MVNSIRFACDLLSDLVEYLILELGQSCRDHVSVVVLLLVLYDVYDLVLLLVLDVAWVERVALVHI